jgi:hypothetical protein
MVINERAIRKREQRYDPRGTIGVYLAQIRADLDEAYLSVLAAMEAEGVAGKDVVA